MQVLRCVAHVKAHYGPIVQARIEEWIVIAVPRTGPCWAWQAVAGRGDGGEGTSDRPTSYCLCTLALFISLINPTPPSFISLPPSPHCHSVYMTLPLLSPLSLPPFPQLSLSPPFLNSPSPSLSSTLPLPPLSSTLPLPPLSSTLRLTPFPQLSISLPFLNSPSPSLSSTLHLPPSPQLSLSLPFLNSPSPSLSSTLPLPPFLQLSQPPLPSLSHHSPTILPLPPLPSPPSPSLPLPSPPLPSPPLTSAPQCC